MTTSLGTSWVLTKAQREKYEPAQSKPNAFISVPRLVGCSYDATDYSEHRRFARVRRLLALARDCVTRGSWLEMGED